MQSPRCQKTERGPYPVPSESAETEKSNRAVLAFGEDAAVMLTAVHAVERLINLEA